MTLDGSASIDNDGAVKTYKWSIQGKQIAIGAKADVKVPVGSHTITLAVTDDRGASDYNNVTLRVKPKTDPVIPKRTLVMWLKADAVTDLADGQAVAKWNDSSASRLFSAQKDPTRRPTWIKNAIGEQPAIRFDGNDDTLIVDHCRGLLYSFYNSTLFAVVRTEKGGAIVSHGHTTLAVTPHNKGTLSYSSAYQVFPSGDHVWPGVRSTNPGAVPLGKPAVLTMRRTNPKSGGTRLFVNGQRDDNGTAIGYHAMNSANGFIGSGYTSKRNLWQGDIAEIILYGRDLSNKERNAVEMYLAGKYRIVLER